MRALINSKLINAEVHEKKRHSYKRFLLLLFIPAGLILLYLSKRDSNFAERYAQFVFKNVSGFISKWVGKLPFSLAEATIVIGIPIIILCILVSLIKCICRRKNFFGWLFMLIGNLACLASVVFIVYVLGNGINYNRYSLEKHLNLNIETYSTDELEDLLKDITVEAAIIRRGLPEDENGVYKMSVSTDEMAVKARNAFNTFASKNPAFAMEYPKPKKVFFSRAMSVADITGVFSCWTYEANVNVDVPDYSLASTMCHELAHLGGVIKEDEANYLSYLACTESTDMEIKYSGLMMAFSYVSNELYKADPERYDAFQKVFVTDALRRDLIADNKYWSVFEGNKVWKTMDKANDSYLKANGQTEGVGSYNKVVNYLLARRRKRITGK